MLLLLLSRPRELSSLLTGVLQGSRLASTTSHLLWCQEEILPRCRELCACCPTPPPSLRPGPGLTTSLTSCTLSAPLFTGTLVRAWRRENSQRLGRTWLH